MRIDETVAEIIVGFAAMVGMLFYLIFGHVSDKIGRKKPIMLGYVLTLVLLFPLYWLMGHAASPGHSAAAKAAPVTVSASGCNFDPFAAQQKSNCGQVLGELSKLGVHYTVLEPASKEWTKSSEAFGVVVTAGQSRFDIKQVSELKPILESAGYDFATHTPSPANIALILLCLLGLMALSGMTYGPVAALLSEMFPPAIRYSSLSIPYHIGTGYFGGFLPLISAYIVAVSGNPYSGLWYTFAVVLMALLVCWWGLPDDRPAKAPHALDATAH